MDLKRIGGVVLVAMAVVVAVHTVVEPLYYASTEESPYSPAWGIIGWLMFVPLALGVAFGYARKRAVEAGGGDGAVTREFVAANVQFYGGLFFGIMFLLNWFAQITPTFTAIGGDAASLVWMILDAGLPLLWGSMGMFLLRGGGE
jgi:hypothetical protein